MRKLGKTYFTRHVRPDKQDFVEGPHRHVDPKTGEVFDDDNNPYYDNNVSASVSQRDRISALLRAGSRLVKSRRMYEFDSDVDIPDDYIDYSREPGWDMSDVTQAGFVLLEKQKAAKRAAAELEKMEKEAEEQAKVSSVDVESAEAVVPPGESVESKKKSVSDGDQSGAGSR